MANPPPMPPEKAIPNENNLDAVVPAEFRADLIMQKQLFRNEEYYVIKDPLGLAYFRLKTEEAFLVTLLDGKRTLREIRSLFFRHCPHQDQSPEEMYTFIQQLGVAGLLNINARKFVKFNRARKRPLKALQLWGSFMSKAIFLKIPLFDPSPWLGKLSHSLRLIWSPIFIRGAIAFFLWTLFWLYLNRDAFLTYKIDFFSPSNLILLWLSIIGIKTLHEFGHATTCRHFGGEVHEMGVCLICLTPCGYVDATDAWFMRHRRHKIYTTLAGIFTEFMVASAAVYLWLYLPESLARNIAFNVMVVASVNTLFFNLNPLMRFDGYYVMLDLFEIPNLRAKAITFCSLWLQKTLLGIRNIAQERFVEDEKHGPFFVLYSICAFLYMLFVIRTIGHIFTRFLEPYGLESLGVSMGATFQLSFLTLPFVKVLSDVMSPGAHILKTASAKWRTILTGLGLPLLLGIVIFSPTHYSLDQQGVALSVKAENIGVIVPGTVEEMLVETGNWVEPGDVLARLFNPAVEAALSSSRADVQLAKLALMTYKNSNSWEDNARIPEASAQLETALLAYNRALQKKESLLLRSKISGYVITPDIQSLKGVYLREHGNVFRIGDTRRMKVVIPLTEDQAQLAEVGSPVKGRWLATGESFDTELSVLPRRKISYREYLPGMLALYGGPAPIEKMPRGINSEPVFALFLAEAEIKQTPASFQEGMRAHVVITGKKTTYGRRIWRQFMRFWN